MGRDPFWSNLFRWNDDDRIDELYELVHKVPIFKDLKKREFRKLEGILHRRTIAPDEPIVREGEKGVGMYIILSGGVHIVQKGEDGVDQILAVLEQGDFFGEQALLDDSPRTASAIGSEVSRLVGFFRPDLLSLIESDPRLGLKIVMRLSQMISTRLRQTNRLLKETRMKLKKAESEAAREREEEDEDGAEEQALRREG